MTVTVAHSESKMSLFQEMKLKRRKADSRCSSDGESMVETSSLSPKAATPEQSSSEGFVSSPGFSRER